MLCINEDNMKASAVCEAFLVIATRSDLPLERREVD